MKKFKFIALVTLVALGSNIANAFSVAEQKAQSDVAKYLTDNNFKVEIDPEDQSVMFKKGDVLYWITFKNSENGLCYTLHRRPIKLNKETSDPEEVRRLTEKATYAANDLNRERQYKTVVKDGRIDFTSSVYSSSPQEYVKMLPAIIMPMYSIDKDFQKAMARNEAKVDSIHNYWSNEDPNLVVMSQVTKKAIHKEKADVEVSRPMFASVSAPADGKILIDFDGSLIQDKCKFLIEKMYLTADKAGVYRIGLKLYGPNGKLIVPNKNSAFTTVKEVEVKKAGKEQEIELEPFGTEDSKLWVPGVYRYELYDGDALIKKDVFSINE